jgi:hypothetical protein
MIDVANYEFAHVFGEWLYFFGGFLGGVLLWGLGENCFEVVEVD